MQRSNIIFSVVMNAFELFWKTLACTICWRTLIDDRTTKQKRLCSKAVQWPKVHTQATYYIPGYIHYTLFCFSKLTWFVIMLIHLVHLTATTKFIFRIPLLESQYILRNLYVQYKELELLLFYASIEWITNLNMVHFGRNLLYSSFYILLLLLIHTLLMTKMNQQWWRWL